MAEEQSDLHLTLSRLGGSNDDNKSQKARAILDAYAKDVNQVYEPLIKLTVKSLERVAKQGGNIDASHVEALSLLEHQAENTMYLLEARKDAGHNTTLDGERSTKNDVTYSRNLMELAHGLADNIVDAGLAQLPVVAQARGRV